MRWSARELRNKKKYSDEWLIKAVKNHKDCLAKNAKKLEFVKSVLKYGVDSADSTSPFYEELKESLKLLESVGKSGDLSFLTRFVDLYPNYKNEIVLDLNLLENECQKRRINLW